MPRKHTQGQPLTILPMNFNNWLQVFVCFLSGNRKRIKSNLSHHLDPKLENRHAAVGKRTMPMPMAWSQPLWKQLIFRRHVSLKHTFKIKRSQLLEKKDGGGRVEVISKTIWARLIPHPCWFGPVLKRMFASTGGRRQLSISVGSRGPMTES